MITVFKTWRPASVVLPDKTQMHRCLVVATSEALQVFERPGEPVWSSPIDFARTVEPRSSRTHIGIDIETDDGLVVVTPTGGCMSCGSRLRGWLPDWASNVAAWPAPEEAPHG